MFITKRKYKRMINEYIDKSIRLNYREKEIEDLKKEIKTLKNK